jgi:hypothetical protein
MSAEGFREWVQERARAILAPLEWVRASEYQDEVDEALEWQQEAHDEREFYDNDSYFFPGTGSTYFHGERG